MIFNLLLRPGWVDYNHVFAKTLHQTEYQILQTGYELGLSKQHIANIFQNQEVFKDIEIPPTEVISQYTGKRKGDIKAEFHIDCIAVLYPL